MKFNKIICTTLAATALLFTTSTTLSAQDEVLKQTGRDFILSDDAEMVSLDNFMNDNGKIKNQKSINLNNGVTAEHLYAGLWNTTLAHPYKNVAKPDSFHIDMTGFHMPTPSRKVTSNFGYRPKFKRYHKGLDIKVNTGDTIYAAFDGVARVVRYDANGYGNYVVLRHENGLETIYGHMSKHLCKTDDVVKAGDPIGLGGNTGRSFGSHLHFETRFLGEAIDPALLFDFPNQTNVVDDFVYKKSDSHDGMVTARK
ncbi:M23 family metallopeptidase [Pseudoprevotella muciniphila]